jgi:hypothetical protein
MDGGEVWTVERDCCAEHIQTQVLVVNGHQNHILQCYPQLSSESSKMQSIVSSLHQHTQRIKKVVLRLGRTGPSDQKIPPVARYALNLFLYSLFGKYTQPTMACNMVIQSHTKMKLQQTRINTDVNYFIICLAFCKSAKS